MIKILVGVVMLANIFLLASSKGMRNPFSIALLVIIDLLICIGGGMIYFGHFALGYTLVFLVVPFMMGFKVIQGANPRKVGIVTYFGERTKYVAEGLTLVANWPFEIIGLAEFETQLEDMDFPITSVRSQDGVRFKGILSMGVAPDEENMNNFDNAKGMKGVRSQLDEVVLSWLQEILGQSGHNWKWVEQNPIEIQNALLAKLISPDQNNNNSLVNANELGIKIKKISVKLEPISTKVIEADEDATVEELQRNAEIKETETINRQAELRREAYRTAGIDVSLQKCRDEVMFERLAKDKKVTITQGGRIVNVGSVGNTDRSSERS